MNPAANIVRERRGPLGLLSWFLLLCLASSVHAGGQSNDGASAPNASSPGDEVTSLPSTREVAGLTFVGRPVDLRAMLLSLRGRGRIETTLLPRDHLAVTLSGDYWVDLDRAALARSDVRVFFRGGRAFRDGLARLVIGDSAPIRTEADSIPLPIARLAASTALGHALTLDVAGPRAGAHVAGVFSADRVVLAQRMSRGRKFR